MRAIDNDRLKRELDAFNDYIISLMEDNKLFSNILVVKKHDASYNKFDNNTNIIAMSFGNPPRIVDLAYMYNVQSDSVSFKLYKTTQAATLFHELVHCLHYLLNYSIDYKMKSSVGITKFRSKILSLSIKGEYFSKKNMDNYFQKYGNIFNYMTDDEEFSTIHGFLIDSLEKMYYSFFNENMYNISTSFKKTSLVNGNLSDKFGIDLSALSKTIGSIPLSYRVAHNDCGFLECVNENEGKLPRKIMDSMLELSGQYSII